MPVWTRSQCHGLLLYRATALLAPRFKGIRVFAARYGVQFDLLSASEVPYALPPPHLRQGPEPSAMTDQL